MSFERVRKIGNGHYRYRESRHREGGKVRSKTVYLGRADVHDHVPAVLEDKLNDKFNAENPTPAGKALDAEKAPDTDAEGDDKD